MGSVVEKHLGARVVAHRQTAGLTQEELAERADVVRETISRLERGVTVPSLNTLAVIAKALNVELHDLFDFRSGSSRKDSALDALVRDLKQRNAEEIGLIHEVALAIFKRVGGGPKRRRARK